MTALKSFSQVLANPYLGDPYMPPSAARKLQHD